MTSVVEQSLRGIVLDLSRHATELASNFTAILAAADENQRNVAQKVFGHLATKSSEPSVVRVRSTLFVPKFVL